MNVKSAIKTLLGGKPKYGFFGFFDTWQDVLKQSRGWNSPHILDKVCTNLLKVKKGEAVYERDSVLFDKIQYSWSLLAGLLKVAVENNGILRVADFGGSLGTTYFQNREFLSGLKKLEWNIIEQENYVACGNKYFKSEELRFFADLESCLKSANPDVLIVSSVIQYLEDPFAMIEKFINAGFKYIIFDRTSFINLPEHKIAIQKVKPAIYDAAFPIWFFNYDKFLSLFTGQYRVTAEFDAFVASRYEVSGIPGGDKGFILKRL